MTLAGVLRPAMNAVVHLYLVTHGVSVPPGSEPGDPARSVWSLTFGSLTSWLGRLADDAAALVPAPVVTGPGRRPPAQRRLRIDVSPGLIRSPAVQP